MNGPTNTLASRLAEAAEQMPPARLPADLWQRGKRHHRRRRAVGSAVALLVAGLLVLPVIAVTAPVPQRTGTGAAAVPSRLYSPWPWQATVQHAPNGPAALLVSGGSAGLRSPDLPTMWGSKIAVVGRDGSYRMLRYGIQQAQAGQDVLLSPDGRYVAGPVSLERQWPIDDDAPEITIVDLTSGRTRRLRMPDLAAAQQAPFPVAWSPDGRRLLVRGSPSRPAEPRSDPYQPAFDGVTTATTDMGTMWLVDVATGRATRLLELGTAIPRFAAFSPDGNAVVVQAGDALLRAETASGTSRTLATLASLGRNAQLAGTGAWRPDGTALTVLTVADGCVQSCSNQQRNQRHWRLVSVDATTGAPLPDAGFDPVTGAAARIAGWQRDGTAVLVRYLDADHGSSPSEDAPESSAAVEDVDLLGLTPGGGTRTLLQRPAHTIWELDVASDLVAAGAFGGRAPGPGLFPAEAWFPVGASLGAGLLVLTGTATVWLVRRRRRRLAEYRTVPPLPTAGP